MTKHGHNFTVVSECVLRKSKLHNYVAKLLLCYFMHTVLLVLLDTFISFVGKDINFNN